MIEMYDIHCPCGKAISVGIYQCGTDLPCPRCRQKVHVPDSLTLKALNGDPYPAYRALEKIQFALRDGITPFDGRCVFCNATGTQEIPIAYSELVERFIDDDGGFRIGLTGIRAVIGKAESVFQTTEFPLILCDQCVEAFERDRPSEFRDWSKWIAFTAIVMAVFQFAFQMWILSLICSICVFLYFMGFRSTGVGKSKTIPGWLEKWTQKIRWFPQAVEEAMEFNLSIGAAHPVSIRNERQRG